MKTKFDCPFDDTALCWAMRLTGLLLAAGSFFFLMKDLVLGAADDWVFTIGVGLGLLTFAISMVPLKKVKQRTRESHPKKRIASRRPALQRVHTA